MSDSWTLCKKCGVELDMIDSDYGIWICPNCKSIWDSEEVRVVTTEYLKEREDDNS